MDPSFAEPMRARPLLNDLAPLGDDLPTALATTGDADGALLALHRLYEADPAAVAALMAQPLARQALINLCAAGPFLPSLLRRVPNALSIVEQSVAGTPFNWPDPAQVAQDAVDFDGLKRALRRLAGAAYLHLASADLGLNGDLFTATQGLSTLAEVALEAAIRFCRAELVDRHGDCLIQAKTPCSYVVLGMGKLGAYELNYGSDIDLIVLYGDGGETTTGRRPLAPQAFFAKLTQRVATALADQTADGRVFRVDLRLRPEGGSGAMTCAMTAATAYYETVGDTWERAAYIKARTVAGDRDAGAAFLRSLTPFVFRRYLDFASLDAIRQVKGKIHARQVVRDQVGSDVKLGTGGIRDIEFFVQSQQLIHGGRDHTLRSSRTLTALLALSNAGHVAMGDAEFLANAYRFLRHVEHRVQLVADQQTHQLPDTPVHRQRLAVQMGFTSDDPWAAFMTHYRTLTRRVHDISQSLFKTPDASGIDRFEGVAEALENLVEGQINVDLKRLNLRDPTAATPHLQALGRFLNARWHTPTGHQRWHRLLPLFLADIADGDDPDLGLVGLVQFAEGLKGRSIYTAMLYENPNARKLLSRLFCNSRFLTTHLARHPHLLDDLLAPPALLNARPGTDLTRDLNRLTHGLNAEAWLDAVRSFKHREVLRTGLRELLTDGDEQTRGIQLGRVAQVVVKAVLRRTWNELTRRHGLPVTVDGQPAGVAVVALGRLGSGEMGYGSDLDLVFIHNGDGWRETDGDKPLSIASFFTRLGQRMVSKLTVPTGAGILYPVDMRLRPSGASGQLVTSLSAFNIYQTERAWSWEKQALTRARVVAEVNGLGPAVDAAIRQAAYIPRDTDSCRAEVANMRAKMRQHLDPLKPGSIELKQAPGGIVDIEFTVQCLLLAHGHDHPSVTHHNPREALIRLSQAGLIAPHDADTLQTALSLYRTVEGYLQRVEGSAEQRLYKAGPPMPGGRERLFKEVTDCMQKVAAVHNRIVGIGRAGDVAER